MRARPRRGATLAELLIAMVIFGIVMVSAFSFLLVQTRSYRTIAKRTDQVQNARFGHDLLRQEIRTAGSNVADAQPLVVYASDSVLAFNADLLTNLLDSVLFTGAIYVDPYASDDEAMALTTDNPIVIPGSSFTYPLADYSSAMGTIGEAETIIFFFVPDTLDAEDGTYALMRQTNAGVPDRVAGGLTRVPNTPFFRYWYDPARYDPATTTLAVVPAAWMPLAKTVAVRGAPPDTGTSSTTRIDQLRAVEVAYQAARRSDGTREVVRFRVPLPNVAAERAVRACGRPPLPPASPTAVWNADSAAVLLSWPRATDDGAGEDDALRYVLWRRLTGSGVWRAPLATIGTVPGTLTYRYRDGGVELGAGNTYQYVLAVQDCTPNLSILFGGGRSDCPMTLTRPVSTRRPRRGFALLSVILISIVAATIALALSMLTMGNVLTQSSSERAMAVDDAALSGLEVARARLNARLDSVPLVGYHTIENGVLVASSPVPVTRSTWVARIGNADSIAVAGEFGVQGEIVSRSVDAAGNSTIRRALIYQQSFARYAYFTDIGFNPGGTILWFANGWTAQGPLHSNDSLYIFNGTFPQAIFRDEVTTAKGILNKDKGSFLKPPPREGVSRIELPNTAEFDQLKAIANRAGYVFTPSFETGDSATITMRIEFVNIDVDGDGVATGPDEGFFRIYQMNATMPNGNGWAMARTPAPPTSGVPTHAGSSVTLDSVLYSRNCGVTAVVSGRSAVPTTFAQIAPASGTNYRARMTPKQNAWDHVNARCFLGGDPRLTATGVFQATDPAGAWLPRTSGTVPAVVAARPDGAYLWPLSPAYNPDFRGVIFVEGRVGVSGTVRGRITLASRDNLLVLHELRQAVDPSTTSGACSAEDDIVGLLSGRHVLWADNMLQTPQQRRNNTTDGNAWLTPRKDFDPSPSRPDLGVHAVILALGSIATERAAPPPGLAASAYVHRGTVRQVGGRIQSRAGQGGTMSGGNLHGYVSDISFNQCALRFPPPYFPTTGHWSRGQFFEVNPIGFSPASWFAGR
jgi:prepilin-type N-terminal cleavage/methylation domain-containing protein